MIIVLLLMKMGDMNLKESEKEFVEDLREEREEGKDVIVL